MILGPIIGKVQAVSSVNMRKRVDEGFLNHRNIYAQQLIDGWMSD